MSYAKYIQGLILREERQCKAQRQPALMCRLTVDGEIKQFSCKMEVPPHLWDVKSSRRKRSSFLPTFVFRPLTPPYVPFGIRRFFTMDAFRILRKTLPRHLLQPSICRSALLYTLRIPSYLFKGSPILLFWFYAFVPTNGSFQLCRLNKFGPSL